MRQVGKTLLPALAAALTLAACGSSSSGQSSSSQASTATTTASQPAAAAAVVKTASNAALGATVLTNASGLTLYSLSAEHGGKFICIGTCTQIWHPVTVSAGKPTGSVGSLGTVKRPEGIVQVTYKGMPLYTFSLDRQPGALGGQNLKDVQNFKAVGTWRAVSITGATSATQTAPASEPTTSGSKGGGY